MRDRERLKRTNLGWVRCVSLMIMATASCGPPLTEPSSQDISGRWMTSNSIGALFDVEVTVSQQPDGTLSGQWSGRAAPPYPPCPPDLGPSPSGPVNGTNTVLAVRLSLLGAGDFDGQAIDGRTLKGSLLSCGTAYAVTFSLVDPALPP